MATLHELIVGALSESVGKKTITEGAVNKDKLVDLIENGELTWETVAREFIAYCSDDDVSEVINALKQDE